jgi:hypothetical protein
MLLKKYGLWIVYFGFAIYALVANWQISTFEFSGAQGVGKALTWLTLLAFLFYSLYSSSQENIAHIIRDMKACYWGRQIGIDLYLGVAIVLSLIYLNEGSVGVLLVWLVPLIIFANLATLLYLAIHFDQIVARFY